MGKTRRCKTCGRSFEPKGADDHFCSPLCRTTGCFVGGGGDTSKPMSREMQRAMERKAASSPSLKEEKPRKIRNGAEKFPRVHQMLELPIERRWELTKQFTAEEREYCRRVMKRMLMEERRIESIVDWDSESEPGLGSYEGIAGGSLGESDDGTV